MDIKDLIDKLEPEQATTKGGSPETDLCLMSITSLAVSMKRLADVAECWWERHKARHP